MMVFTAMQTGVPTITAPQITLLITIIGGLVVIGRAGYLLGDMASSLRQLSADFHNHVRLFGEVVERVTDHETRIAILEDARDGG